MSDRCISCHGAHGLVQRGDLFWCGPCITTGVLAQYIEAVALVAAVDAERARRLPVQRNSAEKQTS
jgi:hypothetical protein